MSCLYTSCCVGPQGLTGLRCDLSSRGPDDLVFLFFDLHLDSIFAVLNLYSDLVTVVRHEGVWLRGSSLGAT